MKNIKYIIENTVLSQLWNKLEIDSLNKMNIKLWRHMETQTHVQIWNEVEQGFKQIETRLFSDLKKTKTNEN
jgi:hypothetical protein